jgi:predicted acylesterase/phospholipase RssA
VAKPYLILSCDGGGVRGLLSALVLKELDRTAGGLLKRVDLFAGTSTGGLIALALAGGLGIDRVINLYKTRSAQIFTQYTLDLGVVGRTALKRAADALGNHGGIDDEPGGIQVNDLVAVKYTNEGLRQAVAAEFPTNPLLTGLARSVLVTTLQLDDAARGWRPVTLHNLPPKDGPGARTHVVEAAMCTTAAPTYFEPFKHTELGYCVDGGVFANNPGGLAVAAAVRAGKKVDDIVLLSVGTGGLVARYPFEKRGLAPRRLGILPWVAPKASRRHQIPALPLVAAMFDGTSAADQLVCAGFLQDRYQRVQPNLTELVEMDDAFAVPRLEAEARKFVATDDFKAAVKWAQGLPSD